MSDHEKTISFHMIHSMKGGCGKSTCALFKALKLAQGTLTEPSKVLFLDADFRGSSMQPLLFRTTVTMSYVDSALGVTAGAETASEVRKKISASPAKGVGLRHTIAIPDDYKPEDNLNRYLKEGDVPYNTLVQSTFSYVNANSSGKDEVSDSGMKMNGCIDFILAAGDGVSKDWFRSLHGKIGRGIYIYRMEGLFDSILYRNAIVARDNNKSKRPLGQYTDVIIDMPPGYDEYSDMLVEILSKLATEEERLKLHYYGVTTEDIGHKKLAEDNIRKMCTSKTDFKEFETVNAILSNPYSAKMALGTQAYKDYNERINNQIQDLKKILDDKGKVYQNEYNSSYHRYCTEPETLEFELEKETLIER